MDLLLQYLTNKFIKISVKPLSLYDSGHKHPVILVILCIFEWFLLMRCLLSKQNIRQTKMYVLSKNVFVEFPNGAINKELTLKNREWTFLLDSV
jgi:hypothetical protein